MINWHYFPKSDAAPEIVRTTVSPFETVNDKIDSAKHEHPSNEVLAAVAEGLLSLGYSVETDKKKEEKVSVSVLFGRNGAVEKYFDADTWHRGEGVVLEIEAGRAVVNNQFLKDLFQASVMHGVDYFGVAVRNLYKNNNDFERVVTFMETLYANNSLQLPLKGVFVIGY
jgi:hypothetical protein